MSDEVPDGTIAEVLDWVGDDPVRANAALHAEYAGQNRSTLITRLEAIASVEVDGMSATSADETLPAEGGEQAPAPEPNLDVVFSSADAISAVFVRDADVEPEDLTPEPEEDGAPQAIDVEQVESFQLVSNG